MRAILRRLFLFRWSIIALFFCPLVITDLVAGAAVNGKRSALDHWVNSRRQSLPSETCDDCDDKDVQSSVTGAAAITSSAVTSTAVTSSESEQFSQQQQQQSQQQQQQHLVRSPDNDDILTLYSGEFRFPTSSEELTDVSYSGELNDDDQATDYFVPREFIRSVPVIRARRDVEQLQQQQQQQSDQEQQQQQQQQYSDLSTFRAAIQLPTVQVQGPSVRVRPTTFRLPHVHLSRASSSSSLSLPTYETSADDSGSNVVSSLSLPSRAGPVSPSNIPMLLNIDRSRLGNAANVTTITITTTATTRSNDSFTVDRVDTDEDERESLDGIQEIAMQLLLMSQKIQLVLMEIMNLIGNGGSVKENGWPSLTEMSHDHDHDNDDDCDHDHQHHHFHHSHQHRDTDHHHQSGEVNPTQQPQQSEQQSEEHYDRHSPYLQWHRLQHHDHRPSILSDYCKYFETDSHRTADVFARLDELRNMVKRLGQKDETFVTSTGGGSSGITQTETPPPSSSTTSTTTTTTTTMVVNSTNQPNLASN